MIEPQTDYERKIIDCVERFGCFAVSVFPDETVRDPPFTYSVGFTKSLGQPEVVFCGLSGDTGHALVNDLFAMCSEGLQLSDGVRVNDLVANYPVVAREVDESWIVQSYFASALWYHRTQMDAGLQDVVQIVWPDADSSFPWDDGCAEWVKADQLAFYEPRMAA
jgi:uncharacterized protein DUF4262